jgi:hypothetical protein
MAEALQIALAGLLTAIQTAIVMYAAYHWPAGRNDHDDHEHGGRHRKNED